MMATTTPKVNNNSLKHPRNIRHHLMNIKVCLPDEYILNLFTAVYWWKPTVQLTSDKRKLIKTSGTLKGCIGRPLYRIQQGKVSDECTHND